MTKFYNVNISSQELKAIKSAIDLLVYTSKTDDECVNVDRIAKHYDSFVQRNKLTPTKKGMYNG